MKRFRLAFILPSLRGGGAERVILTLTRLLAESDYAVDLVLVRSTGPFITEVSPKVSVVDLGHSRAIFSLVSLVRYFWRSAPDVVLPSLPHITIITLLAELFCKKKTIVLPIEHNTLSALMRHSKSMKQSLLPALMRVTYPMANKVICVSYGVKEDLKDMLRLPDPKLTVIYNPVNVNCLTELSAEPAVHPWLSSPSTPILLAAGRLTYAKGFDVLIDAMGVVNTDNDARLIILGEGPEEKNLHRQIDQMGLSECVSIPGFVNNPYPFFRHASLFVLSSRWEGLPTVLIEAIACGAQVVSTDCPSGPREILGPDADHRLVPVDDHEALASKIIDALNGRLSDSKDIHLEQFTEAFAGLAYDDLIREQRDLSHD